MHLYHVYETVELLSYLLYRRVITTGHHRYARETRVLRLTYRKAVDIKTPAREKTHYAGKHTRLVLDDDR